MYTLRTKFKKEIAAEFLPPSRPSNKVIILATGMPGYPAKKDMIEFLSKKGYWVFVPRYRGSWESGGVFLKKSPHQDILDVIDELPKGFTSLFDGKKFKVKPSKIFVIGSSFGGPAAILASRDRRVTKAVAFSPVIDWKYPSKVEPLNCLGSFVNEAFGMGYRFTQKGWNKLKSGKFYSPAYEANKIDGSKILIFHAKDDEVVSYIPTQKFAKKVGCKLILSKHGGHISSSRIMEKSFYKKIAKFLK